MGAALAASAVCTPKVCLSDRAIVVGVNRYASLASGSDLQGAVHDAQTMADLLKSQGFSVDLLTDGAATRKGILDTLQQVAAGLHSDERLVFYFAGHGTKSADGGSALLPADALESSEQHDLGREALYNAVKAARARSYTVLLDSCFSGGLTHKGLGHHVKQTRYHRRSASKDLVRVNRKDNNDHITAGKAICYFTASTEAQTSGEDDFGGERQGVFTHFLSARLTDTKRSRRWGDVQKDVTGEVADYMDAQQTPVLAPSEYADVKVFDPKDGDRPEPAPGPARTVWDDYNEDYSDPDVLELSMNPNSATVTTSDKFSFTTRVGAFDGFLVLLDRDVDGSVYLLFPQSRKAEDARVSAGAVKRFPVDSSQAYRPDAAGNEKVKAILFTSPENAQALLDAMPTEGISTAKMRKLTLTTSAPRRFYTSTLSFGVE